MQEEIKVGVFGQKFGDFAESFQCISQRFNPKSYAIDFAQSERQDMNCTWWGRELKAKVVKGKEGDAPTSDSMSGMPMVISQSQTPRIPLQVHDFFELPVASTINLTSDDLKCPTRAKNEEECGILSALNVTSSRPIKSYRLSLYGVVVSEIFYPSRSTNGSYPLLTPIQSAAIIPELYDFGVTIEFGDEPVKDELEPDTLRFATVHVIMPHLFYMMRSMYLGDGKTPAEIVHQFTTEMAKKPENPILFYRGLGVKVTSHRKVPLVACPEGWKFVVPQDDINTVVAGYWLRIDREQEKDIKFLQYHTSRVHHSIAKQSNLNEIDHDKKANFFHGFSSYLPLADVSESALLYLVPGEEIVIHATTKEIKEGEEAIVPELILLCHRVFNLRDRRVIPVLKGDPVKHEEPTAEMLDQVKNKKKSK